MEKMEGFKTPTRNKCSTKTVNPENLATPLKIPATPFLKSIGYGAGVHVFTLERSPKVGFIRSPWALKKRNRKIIDSEKYNDRIIFEAQILKKLNHPNIVGFRALVESTNGEPCLAMEKLDVSLGDIIEERVNDEVGPFPASDILHIAYEMVKGLEYLHHTANILHGDLKSFNVLISEDLKLVKICDFGVSIPLNKDLEMDCLEKSSFRYIGTECWNPPEVISEEGPVTNKADIWTYGLVIWEMIALSPPHVGRLDDSESEDEDMGENISFLDDLMQDNYGTRPPLPAIDLGSEYDQVLELFIACTDMDYRSRPSAKGLVSFFDKYVKTK